MPKAKNGNGHDVQQAMLEALHSLNSELVKLNLKFDKLNVEVKDIKIEVRDGVEGIEKVQDGLRVMNLRFDHFLLSAGERTNRLEARIERLESTALH